METKAPAIADRLGKLGFKKASDKLKILSERQRKLALAYEFYRFVRQEKIDAFNHKLKKETIKGKEPYDATWKRLEFVNIKDYDATPPTEVLDALEAAQDHQCFDSYEIALIKNVKDPILFGRITGCPDRFFVGQWDNDVKIEDILKPNEG